MKTHITAKNTVIAWIAAVACILMFATAGYGENNSDQHSNSDKMQKDQLNEQKENYDAHRSYVKAHFNDNEMDFWFGWVLGNISGGGCEIGEALNVAGHIKDGDPKSWQDEWEKMAQRVEARAEKSLAGGHKISAGDAYRRACVCYRAALVSMLPDNPRFRPLVSKARSCMQKAGKLYDPPIEYVEIPFENTVLPGYFIKAGKNGKKCRTLVMIGGGETFAEDNYFYIAEQAHKRGYNFMTVDLPGQGALPLEKHFFRYDTEVPMKAVLDYACRRPEVDQDKLAVFGISNGGYFVPRTAMFDKRIKAVVVSAAVVDNYRMFKQMPFATDTDEQIARWPSFKHNIISVVTWRWGLDPSDVKGQVGKNVKFQFDPHKVTCPFLSLIGEGEYANEETKKQQKECMDGLPNPNKKFVVTPLNEGASEHCINLNRSLMSQVVFDWLDEIFEKTGQPTTLEEKKTMKITRIYTGKDGESHFADLEIPLSAAEGGLNISELQKTTGIQFLETHGNFDFHRAPHRQYVIFLDGGVEIETGSGIKKTFQAGDILLAEDTTGRGHIIRTLDEKEHRSIFVTID